METILGLILAKFFKDKYGKSHPEHFEYGAAMKVSQKLTLGQGVLVVAVLIGIPTIIFFIIYQRMQG